MYWKCEQVMICIDSKKKNIRNSIIYEYYYIMEFITKQNGIYNKIKDRW